MSGSLILAGGGDEKSSFDVDSYFVRLLNNNSKVLYIPHANIKQANDFSLSIEWLTETLSCIDKSKKIDIVTSNKIDSYRDKLSEFDAIYIGGGNTYHLLSLLVESGMDIALADYYRRGGIVYGGSAGAIIMGRTIDTVYNENEAGYKYSQGLNLLGGLSVVCHFDHKRKQAILNNVSGLVICLYENSGVIICDDVITNIGLKPFELKF